MAYTFGMGPWGWLRLVSALLTLLAVTSCGGRTELWQTNREAAGGSSAAGGGSSAGAAAAEGGSAPTAGTSGGDDAAGGSSPAWSVVGEDSLIDVFVSRVGVYVVTDRALLLYRRNGELVKTFPSKSRNLSAAFDGEYLSVASEDSLIVSYTLDLNSLFITQTKYPCVQLVLLSRHHAECASTLQLARAYDVLGGANVSVSQAAFDDASIRGVPGSDVIVAFTRMPFEGSAPSFGLFRADSDYALDGVGGNISPVNSAVFGFGGLPATAIVTASGAVLDIYDTSCGTGACFTPNGQLPLGPNQRYLAFETVDAKRTLALLESDTTIPSGTGGDGLKQYEIRTLDVVAGSFPSFDSYRAQIGSVVAMRRDPRGQAVVLGTRLGAQTGGPGYYLLNLPYRE